MNQLSTAKRTAVVAALVEGNSIRSTARMTGVSKPTILKLLVDLGTESAAFHNATVRNQHFIVAIVLRSLYDSPCYESDLPPHRA